MSYDIDLADRIRELLGPQRGVDEKRMFGGLAFLIDGNMSVAVSKQGGLMIRVPPDDTEKLLARAHVNPMVMAGREVRGWIRVEVDGVKTKRQLTDWVTRGVDCVRRLPPKEAQRLRTPSTGKPSTMAEHKQVVRRLLDAAGKTYATEAGVRISDKPMPLFQLLVLCMLASKPIDATIAMRAGHELFSDGLKSPKAVLATDRQTMIRAFGRAHYVRYDESSATRLTEMAQRVVDEYSGDLREISRRSSGDVGAAKRMLKTFKGIGDTGADIFLREIQDVWTWVRPYFDKRATRTAKVLGLPSDPEKLGALAPRANARLAAALVRVSLDDDMRRQVAG